MSKYIDLLRAHRRERREEEKKGRTKSARKSASGEDVPEPESMLPEEQPDNTQVVDTATPEEQLPDEGPVTEDYASATGATQQGHEDATSGEDMAAWLDVCARHVLALFNAAAAGTPADITPLESHLEQLMQRLAGNAEVVNELELTVANHTRNIRAIDETNGDLVQKAVMMMLYAIKTGLQLNTTGAALKQLVLAAMLHHIGMAQIPADIRRKKESLTEKERELIQQAPVKASAYLQQCGISTAEILQAAEQARERYDGSGPQGLSGTDIAYSARLVGLLSMFESLIHYRPYRERLLPRDAIRELVNHHKAAFDPVMLKALIESIS
ncbi:MAG: HD domain-containing phosphohydrolase, partial [Mariprofundaceae bacterium]|nr:HD domain-containing phosphohydrolase [Mariprofundaceae bacterium]